MPSVSPIKHSPIAKYLVENNVKAYKTSQGIVEFRNSKKELIGMLTKGEAPIGQYRYIHIDLLKNNRVFMSQHTEIEKTQKYFLKEHRFMPVKIEIEKTIKDYEHNTLNRDTLTKGLKSDLYIDELKESDALKAERKKLGKNIPEDFPIYKINKPFKYEFKAHFYHREIPIDFSKPIIKE